MYVEDGRGIPSRDEERTLLERAQERGPDGKPTPRAIEARNDLITRHYAFIAQRAHRFARKVKRLDLADDFEQESVLGFLDAIGMFDLSRPVRLITYGNWHIEKALRECMHRQDPIHVPAYLVQLADGDSDSNQPGPADSARRARNRRAADAARRPMVRIDRLSPASESHHPQALIDRSQPDPSEQIERAELLRNLEIALGRLNPALREILIQRFGLVGDRSTLRSLSAAMHVCGEWIRRLQDRALKELRAES